MGVVFAGCYDVAELCPIKVNIITTKEHHVKFSISGLYRLFFSCRIVWLSLQNLADKAHTLVILKDLEAVDELHCIDCNILIINDI